jgi:hypothetical protein
MTQPSPASAQGEQLSREHLHTIARRQGAIIIGVVVYLGAAALRQFIPPALLPVIWCLVLLASAVGAFWLAMAIYGRPTATVLGIVALIPLVGLLVLVVVSSRATGILRQHGIHVGFFGANMAQFHGPRGPGAGPAS